jgi:hypothetical protein
VNLGQAENPQQTGIMHHLHLALNHLFKAIDSFSTRRLRLVKKPDTRPVLIF